MTSTFLIAAVAAGLAFAGLDLARKKLLRQMPAAVILVWLMVATCTFFGSWLVLQRKPWPEANYWAPAIFSISMNVAANLLFMRAILISPLSRTIPFLSLSPAFAAFSAYLVVGECLAPTQWVGILCVVVGALTLNLAASESNLLAAVVNSLRQERGSVLMIVTAACWGLAGPFDKIAVSRASIPVHAFVMGAGVGGILLLILAIRGEVHMIRRVRPCWRPLIAAMILAVVAFGIQLIAYQSGFVGLAETIKRVIGMTSALMLGNLFLQERIKRAQIGAVLLMSLGVALVL